MATSAAALGIAGVNARSEGTRESSGHASDPREVAIGRTHARDAPGTIARLGASSGEELAPLVVIDPGHGGTNTGAPAVEHGYYEKRLTLALARQLRGRLLAGGYRAVLTRERDVYLTLRQRVRRANQLGADLFVSLHANATQTHAQRGYETFILTPQAVDVDGRALRAGDGVPRPDLDRQTALLLDDLERGLAQTTAADLASEIQARLREVRGASGDRGVRQDSMHVLLGATMPAVLVEVGFVDHAIEGRELLDPEVQEEISGALARAITATLQPAE